MSRLYTGDWRTAFNIAFERAIVLQNRGMPYRQHVYGIRTTDGKWLYASHTRIER